MINLDFFQWIARIFAFLFHYFLFLLLYIFEITVHNISFQSFADSSNNQNSDYHNNYIYYNFWQRAMTHLKNSSASNFWIPTHQLRTTGLKTPSELAHSADPSCNSVLLVSIDTVTLSHVGWRISPSWKSEGVPHILDVYQFLWPRAARADPNRTWSISVSLVQGQCRYRCGTVWFHSGQWLTSRADMDAAGFYREPWDLI